MPCFLTNQKKENNQFENKEQPKLPEKHLNRSPTTEELKKHSTRGRRGRRAVGQRRQVRAVAGGPVGKVAAVRLHRQSRIRIQTSLGKVGEQDGPQNPGFQCRQLRTQNHSLRKRSVGIVAAGETPSLIGEYIGETHRVLK